jgi:NADH-quinone oxidoreductase subunit K
VLNAAALNFVAFSRFVPPSDGGSRLTGDAVTAFVILIAAAEAAVALAIVLNIYNNFSTIDVEEIDKLRE